MLDLPGWAQALITAAALAVAVGTLWRKVIHPAVRAANTAEEMLPLLRELTATFKNTPHAFAVLDDIIAQFRTDAGSSLRDTVNLIEAAIARIEAAVENAAEAAEVLKIQVEAAKQLSEQDRNQLARLELVLEELGRKVNRIKTEVEDGQ